MSTTTEQRVRDAALQLFATKGFQATGIRDISKEAGISVASLYHYMASKDDLLVSIMEYGLTRINAAADKVIAEVDGPVPQLAALVQLHAWVHGVRQQSALVTDNEIRSLTGEHLESVRLLRDRYASIWRDVLRRGSSEGTMEVLDVKVASFALLEMCTGISHWYSAGGELTLNYIGEVFADSALGLVRATHEGAPARIRDLTLPRPSAVYGSSAPEPTLIP